MRLQIGHHQCTLMDFPEGLSDALSRRGDYTYSSKRIRVDSAMPSPEQAEVLLHEVLHGCFDAFGWPDEDLTEERVCTLVARGIAQVLQANPSLHAVLHQALTNGKAIV